MQKNLKAMAAAAAVMLAFGSVAQAQTPTPPQPPQFPDMTFFITSVAGQQSAA